MKKSIWIPIIALAVMALALFGVSLGLSDVAKANAQKELNQTMQTLLPGSTAFVEKKYEGENANIRRVFKGETGYVIETATQGYADEIVMLVGVSNEGTVTGLTVRDMHETVGLGANALTDWEFLAQFLKTDGSAEVGTDVDAISGATVTSKAIARCVKSAVGFVTGADVDSGATSWGG
jgi:electron transport complex protein RnfG